MNVPKDWICVICMQTALTLLAVTNVTAQLDTLAMGLLVVKFNHYSKYYLLSLELMATYT